MFLKLEDNKPVVAKIVAYKGTKDGQYGTQYMWDLMVNGEPVTYTTTSQYAHGDLKANGPGTSVTMEKVTTQGRQKIHVLPFSGTVQAAQKTFAPQRYVDDAPPPSANDFPGYAQPDMREIKMGRGASYNLSFQYTLQHHPELLMGTDFFKKVAEYAGLIATEQTKFINQ